VNAAIPERLAELDRLTLGHGSHSSFDAGHCAMEAVAWLAGEPHSDAPACACPVIARAMIRLNDRIRDDATRTELLRPLLPKIIGSRATREVQIKRAYVAADMAVRVFAPLALEKRGHLKLAEKLRAVTEITDRDTAISGRDAARKAYYAADADADADAADAYAAGDAYAAYAAAAAAADAAYAAADAYAAAAAAAADAAYAAAAAADAYAAAADARKDVYRLGAQMIERMLAVRS
jgi:hypothetical protein